MSHNGQPDAAGGKLHTEGMILHMMAQTVVSGCAHAFLRTHQPLEGKIKTRGKYIKHQFHIRNKPGKFEMPSSEAEIWIRQGSQTSLALKNYVAGDFGNIPGGIEMNKGQVK